jgi:hypothetical protein
VWTALITHPTALEYYAAGSAQRMDLSPSAAAAAAGTIRADVVRAVYSAAVAPHPPTAFLTAGAAQDALYQWLCFAVNASSSPNAAPLVLAQSAMVSACTARAHEWS